MTRRFSVRAQARRNYCELAEKTAVNVRPPTPGPSPQGGREQKASAGGEKKETELTRRVRVLYEDSAVPVREIARIAGVTERTIYKYVEKHDWKRRYRCAPRDEAVARANRGRRLRPLPAFAPVKGAGARFIRREDSDKPVATGLKATDPASARLAAARCGGATHLSALALAQAEEAQLFERQIRAHETVNIALKNLHEHREERIRKGRSAAGDRIEPMLMQIVAVSLQQWTALLRGAKASGELEQGLPRTGEARH